MAEGTVPLGKTQRIALGAALSKKYGSRRKCYEPVAEIRAVLFKEHTPKSKDTIKTQLLRILNEKKGKRFGKLTVEWRITLEHALSGKDAEGNDVDGVAVVAGILALKDGEDDHPPDKGKASSNLSSSPTALPEKSTNPTFADGNPLGLSEVDLNHLIVSAVMEKKWQLFDTLRASVKPTPESVLSKTVGDGLVHRSRDPNLEDKINLRKQFLKEAEHYGTSLLNAPLLPFSWAEALSAQARLEPDTTESDNLFTEAFGKYGEAIRLKPNMVEAVINWGIALSIQASRKGDRREARWLLGEASRKYDQATNIDPVNYEAYFNWGNLLRALASIAANLAEHRKLLTDASEKFSAMVRIAPDNPDGHVALGNALWHRAKLPDELTKERLRLLEEASRHFGEAIRLSPDRWETIADWGSLLLHHAEFEPDPVRSNSLFEQSASKYAQAVEIRPDSYQAFYNWGSMLVTRSKRSEDPIESDQLKELASKKFAASVAVNSDFYEARKQWADLLWAKAQRLVGTSEEKSVLVDALKQYKKANEIRPKMEDTLWGLANVLFFLALCEGGTLEGRQFAADALDTYRHYIEINPNVANAHLNCAHVLSLLGYSTFAIEHLEQWAKLAPNVSRKLLRGDNLLRPIAKTPEFRAFIDSLPR